jgi:predicted Zn-dependent protease
VGAGPADGRSGGVRVDGRARPSAVRPTGSAGPLVARRDLRPPAAYDRPQPVREPHGRVRRFVHRYGWRAYAVPLLTLVTLVTLADLALSSGDPEDTLVRAPSTAAPPSATAEPFLGSIEDNLPDDTADGDAAPSEAPPVEGAQPYVEKGAGTVSVVDGTSPVHGSGPLQRFVVEVENDVDVDVNAFADAVEQTLADPRSWGSGGRMSFQRVGAAEAAAGQYEFKVTLISPGSMEIYCPGVGTGGYTSCRYGERAVINLARWATAVPHYDGDIDTYRKYVVNHEVGHALGNGHQKCPGPGAVAPVMQQQTLGLDGCAKNAWPYP